MPVPSIGDLYVPVLQLLAERSPQSTQSLRELLATKFGLTADDLAEKLSSGTPTFTNRVAWAIVKLRLAGLVERVGRGSYALNERGRTYLARGIDAKTVRRLIEERKNGESGVNEGDHDGQEAPEEEVDKAVRTIHEALERELLERVRRLSPQAFEQLVLELLKAMGYGARGEGVRVGRTGDQGVDVEIAEDALGLERICVQAKRYGQGSGVSSAEVRDFLGSLDMRGVDKGVFITSGTFAPGAREVAERARRRVVLVDGPRLVRLMRAYGVGVRPHRTIVLHRLDEDFFSQLEEEA